MKTKEELHVIKEEVETLEKKLAELTEEELAQVTGSGSEEFGFDMYEVTKQLLEAQKELREQAEKLRN